MDKELKGEHISTDVNYRRGVSTHWFVHSKGIVVDVGTMGVEFHVTESEDTRFMPWSEVFAMATSDRDRDEWLKEVYS